MPALFIALNALEISEQQAALAAQQLANRVTNITTYKVLSIWQMPESAKRNTITMQNSNTVPVAVEGKVFLRDSRENETSAVLTFTVPACTEADFSIGLTIDGLAIVPESEFALHNTIDGRFWSVPAPGEQARVVETWLPWQGDRSKPRLDIRAPEKTRKVSACV
ncbi:hypothetical protein AB0C18_03500 [Nonomuraea muscovyensis]|uniref:hypothetical protein n=1 Tax=Nonomuraea muscovyensis TaxID=1124761 RepID=UPI0033CD7A05